MAKGTYAGRLQLEEPRGTAGLLQQTAALGGVRQGVGDRAVVDVTGDAVLQRQAR